MPNSSLEVSHSAGFPLGAAHCSDIFSSGVVCLRADALRYPVRFAVSTCSSRVASADPAIYLTSLCLALATGLSLGFASRSLAAGEKITHPSRPTCRGGVDFSESTGQRPERRSCPGGVDLGAA